MENQTRPKLGFRRIIASLLLLCTSAVAPIRIGVTEAYSQEKDAAIARGNQAARAYNGAAALQNAGLHARARDQWNSFIKAHPKDERIDRAHHYLGVCQLRLGELDAAAKTFAKVQDEWPKFSEIDATRYHLAMAQYEQAIATKEESRLRQASEAFARVVAEYPKSVYADEAIYFQGDCFFRLDELDAAIPLYQRLVAEYSNSGRLADAFYDLGIAQQELGKPDEAAKTYATFLGKDELKSDPLASEIRLRHAVCLQDLGRLDEAVNEFAAASDLKDFAMADYARLRLGQAKAEQNKFDDAGRILADLPKRYPETRYRAAALTAAGRAFFSAKRWDDAAKTLREIASDKSVDSAEASYWLGKSLLKLGRSDEALGVLRSAIDRAGDSPFLPHLSLAHIDTLYSDPARRDETLPLYEAFVSQYAGHSLEPHARVMAASNALDRSQFGKTRQLAEPLIENAKADDLSRGEALYLVAESRLLEDPDEAGNRTTALARYRDLVKRFPEHPHTPASHLRIAWCLLTEKQYDAVISALKESLPRLTGPGQTPEAHLLMGQAFAASDRQQDAQKAFEASLASDGNWSRRDEVLIAAADSHLALKQEDAAMGRLRELIDQLPKSDLRALAIFRSGSIAQRRDRLDESASWFNRVFDQHPSSEFCDAALHSLAAIRWQQSRHQEVIRWTDRLVASGSDPLLRQRGRFLRGMARHGLDQHEAAREDLQAYLKEPAQDSEADTARYTLGLSLIALKQFEAAGEQTSQLLASENRSIAVDQLLYELGHALLADNQEHSAAETFRKLAEKRPRSPLAAECWFRVGQQLESEALAATDPATGQSKWKEAEASIRNGLEIVEDADLREKLRYKLGDTQFRQGRFDAAAETLTAQINEAPSGPYLAAGKFLLAECHYQLGRFDQALSNHAAIVEGSFADVSPESADDYRARASFRAGQCAAKLKQWGESEKRFRHVVDRHARFAQRAEALYGMAYALQQQARGDEAIRYYEEVTKISEAEVAAKARFMIGEIEFGRKKFEDAIEQFLLVTVGYPYPTWQALARFETARCFRELGDDKRATTTLREMILRHPEHPRTEDAKKMLEQSSR